MLLGAAIVLWLAALAAGCARKGTTLFEVLPTLSAALKTPFHITWTPATPKFMLIALLLYGLALALYASGHQAQRLGEEYGSAREDDDDYKSPLDLLFEALAEDQPEHIALRQYRVFKQAAGKTAPTAKASSRPAATS